MTSCVRILAIDNGIDTVTPSIVLVEPGGSKILVNCGEGCQRLFLEQSQKISTVNTICLCDISVASESSSSSSMMINGLPGMILTASDIATNHAVFNEAAAAAAAVASSNSSSSANSNNNKMRTTNDSGTPTSSTAAATNTAVTTPSRQRKQKKQAAPSTIIDGIHIVGPAGLTHFIHSLRHFIRRDRYGLQLHEQVIVEASSGGSCSSSSGVVNAVTTVGRRQDERGGGGRSSRTTIIGHVEGSNNARQERRRHHQHQRHEDNNNGGRGTNHANNDANNSSSPKTKPQRQNDDNNNNNNTTEKKQRKQKMKKNKNAKHELLDNFHFAIEAIVCSYNTKTSGGDHNGHANIDHQRRKRPRNDDSLQPGRNSDDDHNATVGKDDDATMVVDDDTNTNNNNQHHQQQQSQPLPPKQQQHCCSYIFTTPSIPGKFLPDKAKALGVPVGPLYGQLKSGRDVTFTTTTDDKDKIMTVKSRDVVMPSQPPVAILVLYYPTIEIAQQLHHQLRHKYPFLFNDDDDDTDKKKTSTTTKKRNSTRNIHIELMIHITTREVFDRSRNDVWGKLMLRSNSGTDDDVVDGTAIQHIFLPVMASSDIHYSKQQLDEGGSGNVSGVSATITTATKQPPPAQLLLPPFHSSASGAYTRSLLCRDIYLSPIVEGKETPTQTTTAAAAAAAARSNGNNLSSRKNNSIVEGYPMMEYTILPRSKKGFQQQRQQNGKEGDGTADKGQQRIKTLLDDGHDKVKATGALQLARDIIKGSSSAVAMEPMDTTVVGQQQQTDAPSQQQHRQSCGGGELLFTGTGSAIPCKHRNVTGMLLRSSIVGSNSNQQAARRGGAIFLDIGEGSIGQLLRVKSNDDDDDHDEDSIIDEIQVVWISHPHADHHLGLLRLIYEKQKRQRRRMRMTNQQSQDDVASNAASQDKLIIIGPKPIFAFLREQQNHHNTILDSCVLIDCHDCLTGNNTAANHLLEKTCGVTRIQAVPVQHCPYSYACILDATCFGRLVYSGDCRPSQRLIQACNRLPDPVVDVMIHEATFEDGMENEAVLKRHCTIAEALRVARQVNTRTCVLTHFSQRYPKIPPLPQEQQLQQQPATTAAPADDSSTMNIVFAFDCMRLTPSNLVLASRLTPALRLLYPTDVPGEDDDSEEGVNDTIDEDVIVDETVPTNDHVMSIPGLFARSDLL